MSLTSKSPRKVALVALKVGHATLPLYAHRFSPRKFTQPQLFACLALKAVFKTDYRGAEIMLNDLPDLQRLLGLTKVPDHATLHRAAQRFFGKRTADRMIDQCVKAMLRRRTADRVALDASGFVAQHASRYFVKRSRSTRSALQNKASEFITYRRFPKLAIAVDGATHLILAVHTGRGPSPDITHLEPLLVDAWKRLTPRAVLADAGYDAEWAHELIRHDIGARSLIPAKIGRPTDAKPTGYYRRLMAERLHLSNYGQRWQVETVFSMIKRRLGETLAARSYHAQRRAMMQKAVMHNILILLP